MIKIEKKYYFYAGHRNKQAGEKCGRLHGHTYDVKCIFEFSEMKDGVTVLFSGVNNKQYFFGSFFARLGRCDFTSFGRAAFVF